MKTKNTYSQLGQSFEADDTQLNLEARRKIIGRANRLLKIRDGKDIKDTMRIGEREQADKLLKRLTKKYGLKPVELITNIPITSSRLESAKKKFGAFYQFAIFYPCWKTYTRTVGVDCYSTLFDDEAEDIQLPVSKDNEKVIADSHLEYAIRNQLKLSIDAKIGYDELRKLRVLDAGDFGIQSLDGLEYAFQLRHLDLSCNPITNIQPLAHLGHLRTLDLSYTDIKSINPLSELPFLRMLGIAGTNTYSLKPIIANRVIEVIDARECRATEESEVCHRLECHGVTIKR